MAEHWLMLSDLQSIATVPPGPTTGRFLAEEKPDNWAAEASIVGLREPAQGDFRDGPNEMLPRGRATVPQQG